MVVSVSVTYVPHLGAIVLYATMDDGAVWTQTVGDESWVEVTNLPT